MTRVLEPEGNTGTDAVEAWDGLWRRPEAVLALAPMQDITDRAFWEVLQPYGGADLYFTEYFRVYPDSRLNAQVLRSITHNPTGRPVVAQMIGNDPVELVRTARELQRHPVAAIDLNLGCPAPVVYRKCAGGGLLRDPARIDGLLGALRDAIRIRFTVKTRIGFDSPAVFEQLLPLYARHGLDLLTVHGRTVGDLYRSAVRYDLIAAAVRAMPCPVLANGNVHSARHGEAVLRQTGARGLMIGRGAIRNPWIFHQIRQQLRGEPVTLPVGRDVLGYLRRLHDSVAAELPQERSRVTRLKKHLNYIGLGVEPTGRFLHAVRRVTTEAAFFQVCNAFLDHDQPMPLEPFPLELKPSDVMAGDQGC